MPDAPSLFSFEGVTVAGAGARPRLDHVDLAVVDRGVTAIVGPSGAGKSTLLRLCNRLEVASSGCVRFRGDDVGTLDPISLRRRVGMVFQRPTPFAGTGRDNLAVGAPGIGDAEASALLAKVGLDAGFLDRDARALSGGEAQRLCLARTLATVPDVLLLDEPTSSLDGESRRVLERHVRALAAGGVPVLWVTHDPAQTRRVADEVVVLGDGRVRHAAPVAALDDAPAEVRRLLEDDDAG